MVWDLLDLGRGSSYSDAILKSVLLLMDDISLLAEIPHELQLILNCTFSFVCKLVPSVCLLVGHRLKYRTKEVTLYADGILLSVVARKVNSWFMVTLLVLFPNSTLAQLLLTKLLQVLRLLIAKT